MPLRLSLAVTLGLLTFLSSLMLGLGQGDAALPVLMGIAAVTSFILTDYRRIIQLGDWTVNVFVVCIFCFNVVDVLQHRGEDLSWSIARVLVFVQIVLLFREKETRFCWIILLISLLQVVSSTVFHQSILFAVLLFLYVFVGLCAFVLLFLQQEHRYFRQHSFVKTFVESIKAEMSERQDRRKLARIALMTLLMGPLSLVLSFGKKKDDRKTSDQKTRTQEILRSLFLIFPTEEDLAQKERWERIEDVPGSENQSFHTIPGRSHTVTASGTPNRFPLLSERPSFSAGTQNPRPWNGNWRELFVHLTRGTFFTFFMAIIIFCLIPRVGRVEFRGIMLKQDFERWFQPVRQQVNVGIVGINEEIQLGSLGSVIPHHREIIKVRFLHDPDNKLLTDTDTSENPYRAIAGASLYFHGVPLDTYTGGAWTQNPMIDAAQLIRERIFGIHLPQIGATLRPQDQQRIHFAPDADLVTLAMTIQPLDSQVFFAPHPFFNIGKPNEIDLVNTNGRTEESRRRQREAQKTIASTAFKHGVQLDFIPCQESVNRFNLLQIPHQGLDSVKNLAAQWDAESKCDKKDIVGRARFMEQKFLHSQEFSYQLGGTIRDYDLDPLEDFIAHNPKGHCEYFAGALALMLRSVGISSRVVLGFKTEAAGTQASCTIRQSDAHAWVEVYVPPENLPRPISGQYAHWWNNGGWLRLDPTPAPNNSAVMTALAFRWTDWNRFIQSFWNEYVLNMSPNKQAYWIYDPLHRTWSLMVSRIFNVQFWKEFCVDMWWFYQSFFSDAPQKERRMGDGFYLIPPFVILGLLGLACWRLMAMLLSIRRRATEEMQRRITVEFYFRMERMLEKIGQIRGAALTPLEFARQSSLNPLMLPIVEAFYRVRFGKAVLSEEEALSIHQTLEQLECSIDTVRYRR
ncbi:MAG: transglutaminase domain-containing protein [Planctomycetaceae bacterium]|jgi:hypothetical protein|nr:transglutaminase domain-containing protein [Planctomycetaceae bacterium]